MISVYIYKRQKPYGYQIVNVVDVATDTEAHEIINSWANHPYAFATTTPYNTRKTYRKSYKNTYTNRSAAEYIKTLG